MNSKISKAYIVLNNQFGRRKVKWKNYKKFLKTQYNSEKELSELQNKRFRSLIKQASENVPYYHFLKDIFPDIHNINISDLKKIPFLTKEILMINNEFLCNGNLINRGYKNSTSGSSGQKTNFYSDWDSELTKTPLIWRALGWLDIDLGEKELRIWGAKFDVVKESQVIAKLKNKLNNKIVLSSYKLTPSIIEDHLRFIDSFKPAQIHAYPSSIYEISKFILEQKLKPYKPKAILTSGEQLYEWQRDLIQRAFGVNVYSFYGCREVGIIAQECKHKKGLHIMAENIILEVINKEGKNVYDEEGEIVVTDLSNYVFPFIRYKILDRGILTNEPCTCGRTLPLLKSVNGRTFDIIKLSNGSSIGATFFTHVLREHPGIKDFRIYQDKINHLRIEFVADNDFVNTNYFEQKIKKHTENLLNIDFIPVDSFHTPDSGKKQFIKSVI